MERIAKRLKAQDEAKERAKKDYDDRAKQKILASKVVETNSQHKSLRQKIG